MHLKIEQSNLSHEIIAIFIGRYYFTSILRKGMGGHISQKWCDFMTCDQKIDGYGWVYWLVMENVDHCDWYYRSVIENVDHYGQKCWLLIENNGHYGPKKQLNIKTDDCYGWKKIGVWKWSSRDWWSRMSTTMIEKSTCNIEKLLGLVISL